LNSISNFSTKIVAKLPAPSSVSHQQPNALWLVLSVLMVHLFLSILTFANSHISQRSLLYFQPSSPLPILCSPYSSIADKCSGPTVPFHLECLPFNFFLLFCLLVAPFSLSDGGRGEEINGNIGFLIRAASLISCFHYYIAKM
jgi:hypothetical protein